MSVLVTPGTTLGPDGAVASRICWKSSDGTGSLARVGYAICWAVLGTARAVMRVAIA